jgi:hypothetical protein
VILSDGNSREADRRTVFTSAATLACASVAFIFLLHPRLGIRDVDGYAYIMGARSLHGGNGYRDLTGEALNHWPPGYSLVLSVFPNAISAALVLNYLSFGAATGLLFYLLRERDWSWQSALGFSMVLGSGFFRLLANEAHADILSYALFLVALGLFMRGPTRTLPAFMWALLIPVKLIAAVFLPPAIAADWDAGRKNWNGLIRSYLPAAIASAAGVVSILAFNMLTMRTWVPSSHEASSTRLLVTGAKSFATSIPRTFLFGWHGPIMAKIPRVAFPICMILAASCLFSLRPSRAGRPFRVYGIVFLICSALLLCVRSFDPSARLVGYGLIALMLGFRPEKWANNIWMAYGIVALTIGIVNGTTVNSLGINDPRYASLAIEFDRYYHSRETVASNSFHILDIHAGIPSVPVANEDQASAAYREFLWVTLPRFDAVTTAVTPMQRPGSDWCQERQLSGGVMFVRCK